jgi:DNA polymerase theta
MSATLPNLKVLSDWLNASLYQTDYRPIELHEYYSLGGNIYDSNSKIFKEIKVNEDIANQDKELVAHLV